MRMRDEGGVPVPSTFSPHPKVPSEQLWTMTSQSLHLMIGVMRLRPQLLVWAWLAALGAIETAPRPKHAMVSALKTKSPSFLDRPDFFDYPDSDKARLLAVAQFIGEKPVVFINSAGSSPGLFHHILVGFLVVVFFFLLFQFCTHINFQKGA
uniref:fertilization-influencing membrane protein isoform X1 n=1 Tax=Callithrix jacchus TaxID=9483 RepID=UPI00159E26CA|nr:fertilization-influencing membrane protein isoform X1 [Callithrix jacchus]